MNGGTYETMLDKLINVRERFELYNIQLDKYENYNLANKHEFRSIKNDLIKKIKKWMKDTKDPLYSNKIHSPYFLDTLKKLK
jgi:hypothetical protein